MNADQKSPAPDQTPHPLPIGAYVSAGLALVLALEISAMAWNAYSRAQALLRPEALLDRAEVAIRENYPEVRRQLLTEIDEQAPQLAQAASDQLMEAGPDARQWLEQVATRQMKAGLDEAEDFSTEQFREFVNSNRETIVDAFEAIEETPEQARKLIVGTEESLEDQLGVDIQRQAKQALAVHRALNEKLERLSSDDATLEPREMLERRIIRILRAMEEERLAATEQNGGERRDEPRVAAEPTR